MKFDRDLAAYLYEYKSLKLEGIGTFILDEKVMVPNEQEKDVYYPIEGLSFAYNPKSITDEDVIFFLVKKLRKIEPLIRSDLEYYLSNIKALLNLGNPYTIEGIGTLNKTNKGIFEFTSGNFLPSKEDLNPKREKTAHNYPVSSKFSAGKVLVIILIVIAAIAAISSINWGIGFLAKQSASNEEPQPQGHVDTIAQEAVIIVHKTDTIPSLKDTETLHSGIPPGLSSAETSKEIVKAVDSVPYKMVFEVTKSKERAHSRTAQLNDLHSYTQYDSIPINDSIAYFRLFLMMKVAPADTTHVKDSLQTLFGKKVFMEKNHD